MRPANAHGARARAVASDLLARRRFAPVTLRLAALLLGAGGGLACASRADSVPPPDPPAGSGAPPAAASGRPGPARHADGTLVRQPVAPPGSDLTAPGEVHLANVRQLTFGGQNAEAYWSWDDSQLILQVTADPEGSGGVALDAAPCDRIFTLDPQSAALTQLTHGARQTCAYFLPGDERIVYSSLHEVRADCPPDPDRSQGYVWPLHPYDIFVARADGSEVVNITRRAGYDAEATVGPDGSILFTSTRSGDLDVWRMDADGGNLQQLTHEPGYDGGAFFSPDGSRIVWRASRPTGEALAEYRRLLDQGVVRPTALDIYVADADGRNVVQLTDNGKANFAPYFTPDMQSVLFSSNMADPRGRIFDLWLVRLDGSGLQQVTHDGSGFNSFPMFSRDGRRLVFSSNRNGSLPHETNVFVADWRP